MIPAYMLTFIVGGMVLKADPNKPFRRSFFKIAGYFMIAVLIILAWVLPSILPVFTLPSPNGSYAAGSELIYVNTGKDEIITRDPSDQRELLIKIWYPSNADVSDLDPEQYIDEGSRAGFATKYGLPIIQVVEGGDGSLPYTGDGALVGSPLINGQSVEDAKATIIAKAEKEGWGQGITQWRLRDWGISRQRYWGCPIPFVHCKGCGVVPVPRDQLPVQLPDDVTFTGAGNPLEQHPTWKHTTCPACGAKATRETDKALDDLRREFSTVSREVTARLGSLTNHFANATGAVREQAAEAARGLEMEQARLKEQLDRLPSATHETAASMRKALSDQLRALDHLSSLATRATARRTGGLN